ncbi:MAG TPA: hypothetical protein VFW71_05350 [Actinomycetota bacterium]|nr:hypothetical protein [Actinomycetota bacterium]
MTRSAGARFAAGLLVALLGLAGCSDTKSPGASSTTPASAPAPPGPLVTITTSPPTVGSPAPSPAPTPTGVAIAKVAPSHATPAGANAGFLDASINGDFDTACSYALPSEQANCQTVLPKGQNTTVQNGPLTLGNVFTSGNQALVTLIGTICAPGVGCVTNTNPSTGLPANTAGFPAAYQDALSNFNLTQPCEQSGGQWYVDLGGDQGVTV